MKRLVVYALACSAVLSGCRDEITRPAASAPDRDGARFASSPTVDGVQRQITTSTAKQWQPAISGDRIVWRDERNGGGYSDIYLYDLSTSTAREITTSAAPQIHPAISGDRVVWQEYRNRNWDIILYDLGTSTERQLTTHERDQMLPAISGDLIVWMDGRNGNNDIYLYDLSTNTERQITTNAANQWYPRISGDRIVWKDSRNGNEDIYLYDLSTNTERQITTNAAEQLRPRISGDRIVWQDRRNGNYDVYLYDLSTNTERRITTNAADQWLPAISGDLIVWQDSRNGNEDVYLYDLSTNTERQVTTNVADQFEPEISGDRIVWQDDRNGNPDIYLYGPSGEGPPPVASVNGPYSGNEGSPIAFSSAGSSDPGGGALSYDWTFEHGTPSTAANPSRTYRDNGRFWVQLVVTNDAGLADTARTSVTIRNVAPTASFWAPGQLWEGSDYTMRVTPWDVGPADRGSLQTWLDCGQGAGYQGPYTGTSTWSQWCPAVPDQDTLTVRAKVRDKDGAEREYTRTVEIHNAPPVVRLSATTATTIPVNGSVSVEGVFTDVGVNDGPWHWTIFWGDGLTSGGYASEQNTAIPRSHRYGRAGTFRAWMRVKDKDGTLRNSDPVTITVNP